MHPALSIVFFTTLSGLGYGLAGVLGLGLLDPAALATKVAHVLALALIAASLLSSTLHLGNPQRAWRALSQWRSSWLSREGVMAIVTFVPLVWSAAAAILSSRYEPVAGFLGTVLCAGTVFSTAMIYASLKSVIAWQTPLTPACYLLFAAAGGLLLATTFAATGGTGHSAFAVWSIFAVAAAWGMKWLWWKRMAATPSPSSAATATGLGFIGKVRLFERPHMTENYLTREMGFKIARKHARKLRAAALVLGALIPIMASVPSVAGLHFWPLAFAVVLSFSAGVLMERWLFFAEAKHVVMSYYGG